MPRFGVHVGEIPPEVEPASDPAKAVPEVRDVYWTGEAADPDAAREAAHLAWDEKYGSGKQPISAIVNMTPLDG